MPCSGTKLPGSSPLGSLQDLNLKTVAMPPVRSKTLESGRSPDRGRSPVLLLKVLRQGIALPHIRRRSRNVEPCLTSGGEAGTLSPKGSLCKHRCVFNKRNSNEYSGIALQAVLVFCYLLNSTIMVKPSRTHRSRVLLHQEPLRRK